MHRPLARAALGSVALVACTAAGILGCSSETTGVQDPCNAEGVCSTVGDPEAGNFTLDEALAGLPEGPGPLRAIIDTDLGAVTCSLFADKAPFGVANFVGLARGVRPWLDVNANVWVKRPYYDGLLFHRVIPEFMAQGGDPSGTGKGGPGYKLTDEIVGLSHVPGTLAYANSGPNSSGSQFYITEVATPELNLGFTIFGLCTPVSTVTKLTHVPRDGITDRPLANLHMKAITITRSAP